MSYRPAMIGRSLRRQTSLQSDLVCTVTTPGPPFLSFWTRPTKRGLIGTSIPHALHPISLILSIASDGRSLGVLTGYSRQKFSAASYSSPGASSHLPYLCYSGRDEIRRFGCCQKCLPRLQELVPTQEVHSQFRDETHVVQ